MLNALKRLFGNEEVTVVKKGRGRYINFHSYKIFESGRIETSDGQAYVPLEIDGKAYLTLQFGNRTRGAAKIEVARIIYSYLVEPIDIVDDKPVIIYKDGNGMNFRLDNIELIQEEYDKDVQSVVEDIEEDTSDDVQDVINENNTGSVTNEEQDITEEVIDEAVEILEDEDVTVTEVDTQKSLEELEKLINTVSEMLNESEEEKMEETKQEVVEETIKTYSIENMNNINRAAAQLVQQDFAKEIRDRENNIIRQYSNEIFQRNETIANLEKEISEMNEKNRKMEEECYIIKKDTMQKIYGTFDKLISMIEELRKN